MQGLVNALGGRRRAGGLKARGRVHALSRAGRRRAGGLMERMGRNPACSCVCRREGGLKGHQDGRCRPSCGSAEQAV